MLDLMAATLLSLADFIGSGSDPDVFKIDQECVDEKWQMDPDQLPETYYQDCAGKIGTAREIRNWVFSVFVAIKSLSLGYKLFTMIRRYKKTHDTYCLPEVFFVGLTSLPLW